MYAATAAHAVWAAGCSIQLLGVAVPGVYVLELTGLDGERDMVRVVKE